MVINKVHVVFKTHLDIGFTDLSANVIKRYMQTFLPNAIALARKLNTPQHKRFIWTVGSWLIDYAFKHGDPSLQNDLVKAIENGDIVWHALPFTTHTELMDEALFEYGISLSRQLDERFGRTTIAAKMTDVPGHTCAMLRPLQNAGVKFLHIGVNDVCRKPEVPPLFVWQDGMGASLVVAYAQGYGGVMHAPGTGDALCFVHSNDNAGPPSEQTVLEAIARLQREYPDAVVQASTMDAFAQAAAAKAELLPVVTGEIGDTWIHGVGTDPYKVSAFKALSRLGASWKRQGVCVPDAFYDALLMVPEHTWGLDVKKYMNDFLHWSKREFVQARSQGDLKEEYADIAGYEDSLVHTKREYAHAQPPVPWQQRTYELFESSHQEQRDYLAKAMASLSGDLLAQARRTLEQCSCAAQAMRLRTLRAGGEPVQIGQMIQVEGHRLCVLPDGGIALGEKDPIVLGTPIYQQHGQQLYNNFGRDYMNVLPRDEWWGKVDYFKPGMESAGVPDYSLRFDGIACGAWINQGILLVRVRFGEQAYSRYGAPREVLTAYEFSASRVRITAVLSDKDANRLPEALYMSFAQGWGSEKLYLHKLGQWIDPSVAVAGGNDRYHAVEEVRLEKQGKQLTLRLLDTPLVSLDGMRLLDFSSQPVLQGQGVYVNLYNNLWGTNFKMWYEEDILARFELVLE